MTARPRIWLFYSRSMLKTETFYPIFPLADSVIGGFYSLIPLEFPEKSITRFLRHSQKL